MLEEDERAAYVLGLITLLALAGTDRIGSPSANGNWCRSQRVEPAAELKLEESVEVVHMYYKRLPQLEYPSPPSVHHGEAVWRQARAAPIQL
ncbi:MAG TPA: hypothetical protein VGJ79_02225 [Candidatus Dormibacteraeota bacterium]